MQQISPSVLKALEGRTGKRGPIGKPGAAGPEGPAGQSGPAGPSGAAATKLFAQVDPDTASVNQQSGGISVVAVVQNEPTTGYFQVSVAFPQNLESCVAQATLQVENGVTQTGGGTDDHALHTTIDANIVRVYRPVTSGGFVPSFSVVVFC